MGLSMNMRWDQATEVTERYGEQLLAVPGVVGVSTGVRTESGKTQPCIRVYLSIPLDRGTLEAGKIPWELEGVPVEIDVTGEIEAY